MTEVRFDAAARLVPDREVRARVDRRLALAIWNRQAAAARDGTQIAPRSLHGVHHGITDSAEMLEVSARADVHVQADQVEPVALDERQRFAQVLVPDAVFARFAAGVDL